MEGNKAFITKEDCVKILENYLQTSNDIKYISFDLKPISENVEGFMGEHFKLQINYELSGVNKISNFFVKTKPIKSKAHKEITDALGIYEKEIFIYDVLLKEFRKYGLDSSFAANSYLCIPGETLVMDDITLDGYSVTDRNTNLSLEHLKLALEALAKYHGAGFAYEDRKSKQLGKEFTIYEEHKDIMKELFFVQYIDHSLFAMNWWLNLNKTLHILFDLLPEGKAEELKKLLEKAETGKNFTTKTNIRKICGHGDLWSNNILFKYENNIPIKCKLVDFQLCRYFYPCFDVLLAIFSNTNREFRKIHIDELYLHYHNTLEVILKNYGLNIEEFYSLKDFYESIKLVKVEALMQVILTNIVINIPTEMLSNRVKNDTDGLSDVLFDHSGLAADAYKSCQEYRNIINDDLSELQEAWLERINSI